MMQQQLCTFHLDDLFLGVEVERVQEVLRYQSMTRIPLSQEVIEGLINLRGQIVTAIDLRRRLGLRPRDPNALPMNVVLMTDTAPVSFLVDEIGDVLEVDETAFEEPPETLDRIAREVIRGVYKLPDRLLLILDAESAMNVPATGHRHP